MKTPKIIQNDPWLTPFRDIIQHRIKKYHDTLLQLLGNENSSLVDFANGHLFYGCFLDGDLVTIREWLPNATRVNLIGDHSGWEVYNEFDFKQLDKGVWEINLPAHLLPHGALYRLKVFWEGGEGERIPAWSRRVVQDSQTHIFSAQVWLPQSPYHWKQNVKLGATAPIIYEAHIGMSGEKEGVSTFDEFRMNVLPRIIDLGYNTIQLMAIQEHPYYGSFGYHVSGFFAVSSRFGTLNS
jgi:1,4-alpha-glucan branching enzyme